MRPPNTHYTQFKLLYQDGLRRLDEVPLPPEAWKPGPAAERAREVADEALTRLSVTPFGATFFETRVLTNAFDALDDGLWQCVDAAVQAGDLPTSDPAYIWSMERCYEVERRLRFFGEVGALYHYFRDLGSYLDTDAEQSIRRQYLDNSTALVPSIWESPEQKPTKTDLDFSTCSLTLQTTPPAEPSLSKPLLDLHAISLFKS